MGSSCLAAGKVLSSATSSGRSAGFACQALAKKCPEKPARTHYSSIAYCNLAERNRAVLQHLPQVRYIARSIHERLPRYIPLEDLVSAGVLGLMEALRNFDPRKNVQFKSYSKIRIQGAILDSLRELDWGPRGLRKRAREIECTHQSLMSRLGRTPFDTEVAAELGISLEKYSSLRGELRGLEITSLQALGPENGRADEESSSLPAAASEDPFSLCLGSEMNRLLARAVGELPPRKRQVLVLYYFEELTMKEVGARLGVGESRVSQIHSAALLKLRGRMQQFLRPHPEPGFREHTRLVA